MAEFVCTCFAILEYADQFIVKNHESTTRVSAEQVLGIYSPKYSFTLKKDLYFTTINKKFHLKKLERILWNISKKGKGPKKIHFKEKMLHFFFLLISVCSPKIFYY